MRSIEIKIQAVQYEIVESIHLAQCLVSRWVAWPSYSTKSISYFE